MRNLKRALSLALALVMVISMMVVGVSAVSVDDFSDGADVVNKEAVSVLATLNVINGKDDGSYDPTGVVTRAEMAKMICVILNGGKDPVLGETLNNTYTDTANHWAKSYIEYCTTLGIVAGKGDGTFDPNGNVTVAEAGKMVLVALGYNAGVEGYTGANWQINTDVRANALGLYEDLSYTVTSADLTRDNAAQLLYNALDVRMVTYSYVITGTADNAITTKPQLNDTEKGTLLWEMFRAVKVEGVAIANEFSNLEGNKEDTDRAPKGVNVGTALDANRTRVVVSNDDEQSVFTGTVTFPTTTGENVLGKAVWMYVKPANNSNDPLKATVIGSVFVDESNNVITDASGDKAADVADDNNLDINADTKYAYNYGAMSSTAPSKDGWAGVVKTIVDTDGDGYVDYVLYKEMRLGKVTLKNDADDGQLVVGVTGNGSTKGNYIADDKDDVMGFENVEKDNFVLTAFIGGKLHVQLAETMTGTIEAYKQTEVKNAAGSVTGYRNTNFTVSGENYTVSRVDTYTGTELTAAVDEVDKTILSSEATFYLDENGYLVAYGEVDEAAYKYAYVWGAASGDKVRNDEVKVTLEDGSTKTYYLSTNSDIDVIANTDSNGNPNASTAETANAKAKITERDMEGKVFSYTITSSGEIKLYLSANGTVDSNSAPTFNKGLTAIKVTGAGVTALLKPHDVTVTAGSTYYSNNSTTFFYVVREGDTLGGDIKEVRVYNGRNNAPSVDPADNPSAATMLALNRKGDVGAAVFDNVKVSESAGQHLFVTANSYVSEDYCLVNAYLNGSTELSVDLKAALYQDGEIVNNPTITDGLYLYTINSDGYYELTKPVMGEETYFFTGTVGRVNTANSTFAITADGSANGALIQEFRIASTSIVVDNDLNTVIAVAGGSVSVGDEVEVIVNNKDDSEVLMIGILKHGDPTANNGTSDVAMKWDGKTQPGGTTRIYADGTAATQERIAAAFQTGDVYIDGSYTPTDSALIIPKGRALYVTGDVATGAGLTNEGSLYVGGDLSTTNDNAAKSGSYVEVHGNWTASAATSINGEARVGQVMSTTANHSLTVASGATLLTGSINIGSGTLTVAGHAEATGYTVTNGTPQKGNVTAGIITVTSDTTLIASGTISATTLNVGNATNAGKVSAADVNVPTINAVNGSLIASGNVTATTMSLAPASTKKVDVTVSGNVTVTSTVTVSANTTVNVTGKLTADVNVDNGSLKVAGGMDGDLTITGAAPVVNVPTVTGTVNNTASGGTINAGTSATSVVTLKGDIISGNTYSGEVIIDANGATVDDTSRVTLIFNGKVSGLDNLNVAPGGQCTVVFGSTASVTGGTFAKFVAKDGSALAAKDLIGSTFKWDGSSKFVMSAAGAYYNANNQTVAAIADNSSALYV